MGCAKTGRFYARNGKYPPNKELPSIYLKHVPCNTEYHILWLNYNFNVFEILDDSILISFIALFAVLLPQKLLFRPFNRHRFKNKKAKQTLKKLQKFDHPRKISSYLRMIDPFVFEKLFLTAFENKDYGAQTTSSVKLSIRWWLT